MATPTPLRTPHRETLGGFAWRSNSHHAPWTRWMPFTLTVEADGAGGFVGWLRDPLGGVVVEKRGKDADRVARALRKRHEVDGDLDRRQGDRLVRRAARVGVKLDRSEAAETARHVRQTGTDRLADREPGWLGAPERRPGRPFDTADARKVSLRWLTAHGFYWYGPRHGIWPGRFARFARSIDKGLGADFEAILAEARAPHVYDPPRTA